jgi:hypothetical protein
VRPQRRLQRKPVRQLITAIAAAAVLLGMAAPVHADSQGYFYAGDATYNGWWGVDGYIRQSGSTPLSLPQHHNVGFSVCEGDYCGHMVQTGEYQGFLPYSSSPSTVHMYYENFDNCGQYYQGDVGAPPQPDYAFYITYDFHGPRTGFCPDHSAWTYYQFEYRKGSWNSVPFHYGQLGSPYGVVVGQTEVYPSQTIPYGTDYTGCDTSMHCQSGGYGVHLYNGGWNLWTNDEVAQPPGNPPYFHRYQTYWAWATCKVQSAC